MCDQCQRNTRARDSRQMSFQDTVNHVVGWDLLTLRDTSASTHLRSMALCSIERSRPPELKDILLAASQDANPAIALQAVRALFSVFRSDRTISEYLNTLFTHPNEMIRDLVAYELSPSPDSKCHTLSPQNMENVVVCGDALEVLTLAPADSVHLTFTSPPYYNARDYTTYGSYQEYLDTMTAVFTEVHRLTKEGRFLVVNTSPVILQRAARKYASRRYAVPFDLHGRLSDIGWEFIDDIVWAKPEESVKNRIAGFSVNRKPLTYKPNQRTEYVMVYRRKSSRLIDWNIRQYPERQVRDSLVKDGFESSNIWDIAPARDRVHNGVFPLELCERVVQLYSFVGDLVLDPFAGTGTTGAAAMSAGRQCFMVEFAPKYVARICEKLGQGTLKYLNTAQFAETCERVRILTDHKDKR